MDFPFILHNLLSNWSQMKKSKHSAAGKLERNEPPYDSITVKYLLRRLHGKSRSILALGDDGLYYVVKFAGNPKGTNALANELLGYQLAGAAGIRVPRSYLVSLPPSLIRNAPVDWFTGYTGAFGAHPGVHLATEFVGSALDSYTTDLLPKISIPRVRNRHDFLGMLIFDIWTNNKKPRQAVFERAALIGWHAAFIDFGSCFGGPECVFCDDDFGGFYFDVDFYKDLERHDKVDYWIATLRHTAPEILARTFEQVPSNWYTPGHLYVRSTLSERLNRLEEMVYPIVERLRRMHLNYGDS